MNLQEMQFWEELLYFDFLKCLVHEVLPLFSVAVLSGCAVRDYEDESVPAS